MVESGEEDGERGDRQYFDAGRRGGVRWHARRSSRPANRMACARASECERDPEVEQQMLIERRAVGGSVRGEMEPAWMHSTGGTSVDRASAGHLHRGPAGETALAALTTCRFSWDFPRADERALVSAKTPGAQVKLRQRKDDTGAQACRRSPDNG